MEGAGGQKFDIAFVLVFELQRRLKIKDDKMSKSRGLARELSAKVLETSYR